jgi:hypothetical protein
VREFFTGRRPATPTKKHDRASDERQVSVSFHPPAIDRAIDRNIEAIAHLMAALTRELEPDTRDHLLLAKTEVTLSNRSLSELLDACSLCGYPGLVRVCRNCGARKGKAS